MLGATLAADGAHFSLFSSSAPAVTLLFEDKKISCTADGNVWRAFVPGARLGQRYAWEIAGKRLRCPYGRLFDKEWAILTRDDFDWQDDRFPNTPLAETVIYEAHVRGLTMTAGVKNAGTYLALPEMIAHLKKIGVTAVELLPLAEMIDEPFLQARGLVNYWGYNPIGYFAPAVRYAVSDAVVEFKTMVRALHHAGLEVLLDVVYNHTAEGPQELPALSFRGIDNAVYYRVKNGALLNHSGCGNTLDCSHAVVHELVLDSLRYWVNEMHVDGFRFDLAAVLGRDSNDAFNPHAPLLQALRTDPVLSKRKLIVEPWDADTYQLGNFPAPIFEWNDRFRDNARHFWKKEPLVAGALAEDVAGALPRSLNFVTAHDGFTLRDCVSYEQKHNDANGENNHDGTNHNHSCNFGVEGETKDAAINKRRLQQRKNLLATLFFSRGVPMLLGGDEIGRTQHGNNNAYCQDNDTSWLDWKNADHAFAEFVARLAAARRTLDFSGPVTFFRHDGAILSKDDWQNPITMSFAVRFGDRAIVLFNASPIALTFCLPPGAWKIAFDTTDENTTPGHIASESVQALRR